MSELLEGRCACRAVRYRMNDAPMFVNCCHCVESLARRKALFG
jgi:hypothetical protein